MSQPDFESRETFHREVLREGGAVSIPVKGLGDPFWRQPKDSVPLPREGEVSEIGGVSGPDLPPYFDPVEVVE